MFRLLSFTFIIFNLLPSLFANQYADILIEGEVKSSKSYWSFNPITFRPLRILSEVGIEVHQVTPLKRTEVDDDDLVIDEKVTLVGKGYRLDPIKVEESSLASILLIQEIQSKSGKQYFEWGGAPDANDYIYRAGKLLKGPKGPTKFKGVLKTETYMIDGKVQVYSKLDVVEIIQEEKHYRNLFLRELFSKEAEQQTRFEELYDISFLN